MSARLPWTAVRYLSTRMRDFQEGALKGFCLVGLKQPGAADPYTAQDFEDLRATGANLVRVPIILRREDDAYAWPADDVAYVERVLGHGARLGFRVILVAHTLPDGQNAEWWDEPLLQQSLVDTWRKLAIHFEFFPALQGYDILNEPVGKVYDRQRKTWWRAIAQNIATAIRSEDLRTPIIVEPCWWAKPGSLWQSEPIQVTGLVYSIHWYDPQEITHQGLTGYPAGVNYPSATEDKAKGYERLVEARKFTARTGIPIYVGEFSCIRHSPEGTAEAYVADALTMFADERWCWTYHVWRGWDGWDAEKNPQTLAALQAHMNAAPKP